MVALVCNGDGWRAVQRLLGVAVVLLLTGRALAADLAIPYADKPDPPAAFNWSGFYVGAEGGGAWGSHSFLHLPGDPQAGVDSGSALRGGIIGGNAGFNYQLGNWVYGLEGDLSWANASGSAACPNPVFTCGAKVDWFGTARVRIGRAVDHFLPYVTGGLAYGNEQRLGWGAGTSLTENDTHLGWTIGAGIEYALNSNWSFRAENLYVDLSNDTYPGAMLVNSAGGVDTYFNVALDAHLQVVRAGLSYKFAPVPH
jgi:outer membrane immunogenic protein